MSMSITSLLPQKKSSEKDLKKRLRILSIAILGIIIFSILSLFLFPTQVGSFFGFFSKHRNEKPYVPTAKPSTPVFENAPQSVKDTKVTLNGRATPGTTIKIFVNGPQKAVTTVGSDGVFTFADVPLTLGKNLLFARASDNKGFESDNSEFLSIIVDKDAPKVDITNLKDGDTVKNLNKRIEIVGTVNEKATITINDKFVIQKADFSFDYWLGVDEGSVKIKIVATDTAGNKTEKNITLTYSKSS
jgi:Glucodextranase, domain B